MLIYLQMIEDEADRSKFERIYRKYRGLMLHVARRILSDPADCEDAVHQAFVSIIENLEKISAVDCPQTRSFVVIITERKAIDIVRARKRIVQLDSDARGVAARPTGENALTDALLRMNAQDRELLLLRYDNGYSTQELAKLLGVERSTVQKRIWRAKQALQRELAREEETV